MGRMAGVGMHFERVFAWHGVWSDVRDTMGAFLFLYTDFGRRMMQMDILLSWLD